MPDQPDDYEPTEADIDMVVEEVSGKPVKPADRCRHRFDAATHHAA